MSGRRGARVCLLAICLLAIVGSEGCGDGKKVSLGSGGSGGGGGNVPDGAVPSGGTGVMGGGSGGAEIGGAPPSASGGAGAASGGMPGAGGTTGGEGGGGSGGASGSGGALGTGGTATGSGGKPASSGGTPGSGGAVLGPGGGAGGGAGSEAGSEAGSSGSAPGNGGASAGGGSAVGGAGSGGASISSGGAGGGGGQAGVGGAAGNGGSSARPVPPHMLFIFDNSGSMLANASGTFVGENTNICPIQPSFPTTGASKLFVLKTALRAVLADIGTKANVGLMSFPIVERTPPPYSTTTWCPTNPQGGPSGHYAPTPAKMTRNLGCDMTSHDSETTFGPWFTAGVGEVIRTGVTTAVAGTMPLWFDYDPFDANVPAVESWINNIELPMDPGKVTDPELHGMSNTPLGRSLFYAHLYFDNFVIPSDPHAACRQNVVVLLTDGDETCDTAAPDQTFDTVTCAGGGTFSPFHPAYQACRLRLQSAIKTYVIMDSGTATSGQVNGDRIASAGGTSSAVRVTLTDSTAAKLAIQRAIALSIMPAAGCPM